MAVQVLDSCRRDPILTATTEGGAAKVYVILLCVSRTPYHGEDLDPSCHVPCQIPGSSEESTIRG
jgi:hypothetical protein